MQSMPLLLRQSFRSSLNVSKRSSPRLRTPFSPSVTRPGALQVTRQTTTRDFSVCLRYQFRAQPAVFSPGDPDRLKNEKNSVLGEKDAETRVDPDVEGQQQQSQQAQQEQWSTPGEETVNTQGQVLDGTTETNSNSDPTENGRLPSSLERRRSQYSKQFTEVMDNLQSNIFVAGQRLNDLTGYSSIEALKKEIQLQEERLRSARARIRESKEAYAAAINRRSASQREVNDLLQRKNNWSPADLERFTHLYRNDHTNEVAENDTQEALTLAEHDAEEASAALSKSILSRYHEEQVWSDKIRRMSTWGTWGLMGVNVLLFLIFQIAVEPWRRKRLVKGFEDKVIEAIEKERVLHQPEIADADADAHTGIDTSSLAITSETPAVVNESATSATPAVEVSESQPVADPTAASSPTESADKHTMNGYLEHWTHTWNDLLSNRTITITQRDLTTVAVQSAAAGAAVMGLVIALIRPR